MSWMQQLYETYEQCAKNPEFQTGENRLLPLYHHVQQAHIEVTLNNQAEFVSAKVLNKEETILPATEASAGRAGNKDAPHALADKIQYCAGDYSDFGGQKESRFDSYIKQLSDWCISSYSHPKVKIILEYLKKERLVADLVKKGILHIDDKGNLLDDWISGESESQAIFKQLQKAPETKKYDQGSALVRWRVEIPGDTQDATWEDISISDSWRNYCLSLDSQQNVCHISGKSVSVASNHPRKIRNSADGAKLISVPTDSSFYTYKGLFIDASEACTVGVETTQKAHNALRWLIARQGFRNGDQVIVSWAVSGKDTPRLTDNSLDFLDEKLNENEEIYSVSTGQNFALKLNKKIAGYQQDLGVTEQIVVMGLDSASSGRISIVFYRELSGSDFLNRIEKWHLDFAWLLYLFIKNDDSHKSTPIWRTCAPSPKNIAEAAYGKGIDEKLKKATIERLLPCIVDGISLPRDLLESSIRRTSNRESMEHFEWQQSLGITCALFKGYYARHPDSNQRRNYDMALERERKSRDYLYGRLLAIAEQIESYALYMANEKRITNAERLMLRFSSHPCSTWKSIEESLRPYKDRLRASKNAGLLHYWEEEIEQACSLFNPDDFTKDKPLSGEYLLGYHCQKHYRKPKDIDSIEHKEQSGE